MRTIERALKSNGTKTRRDEVWVEEGEGRWVKGVGGRWIQHRLNIDVVLIEDFIPDRNVIGCGITKLIWVIAVMVIAYILSYDVITRYYL